MYMKKLYEIESLGINILELTVIVFFLVASVVACVKFPHHIYTAVFVGGALVAYFSGRKDMGMYYDRRAGFKSVGKYFLHALWVIPCIFAIGALIGWIFEQPFSIVAAIGCGIDAVGFSALVIAAIVAAYRNVQKKIA